MYFRSRFWRDVSQHITERQLHMEDWLEFRKHNCLYSILFLPTCLGIGGDGGRHGDHRGRETGRRQERHEKGGPTARQSPRVKPPGVGGHRRWKSDQRGHQQERKDRCAERVGEGEAVEVGKESTFENGGEASLCPTMHLASVSPV